MSRAAIDRLDAGARALRSAMEAGEAGRIEAAAEALALAARDVQAIGAVRADADTREALRDLRTRLVSDRMLACLLGDLTARRLDLLAKGANDIAPATYARRR